MSNTESQLTLKRSFKLGSRQPLTLLAGFVCCALLMLPGRAKAQDQQQECKNNDQDQHPDGELQTRWLQAIMKPLHNHMDLALLLNVIFFILCGYLVSKAKQYFIMNLARVKDQKRLGRISLLDNFLDFIIFSVTFIFLSDTLKMYIGPGMNSLFAAGGIGALVFGLASKGLAEQVVGGLVVAAWDVFQVGDRVVLHKSGISGKVQRIGLADTAIMGYDNILVKVPNSQIFNQHVSNLSRVTMSPVQQKLRFKYSDLKKMPKLVKDIKQEILEQCGEELVVADGS
eukprot:CAMPEP_0198151578 /NCGR_PEP_ID=MMETSP1443-20131203/56163_1 /TAXON_ID=186043 /ORGANISM="Entomoneis sp., Strain CCMP2396" /LENGTH=284 /DNA_ID=CAMNT_0043817297 /DNA_START=93 /DNA_END=944 /DNA_ORIENTATION=-